VELMGTLRFAHPTSTDYLPLTTDYQPPTTDHLGCGIHPALVSYCYLLNDEIGEIDVFNLAFVKNGVELADQLSLELFFSLQI